MSMNLETRPLNDCRDKGTDEFNHANNGTSEQLELTPRGIEMLYSLNDAFDNDHDVWQMQPAEHPSTL